MNQTVKAVYKNGVFRLLEFVDLQEGEEVRITVKMLKVMPDQTADKGKANQINPFRPILSRSRLKSYLRSSVSSVPLW